MGSGSRKLLRGKRSIAYYDSAHTDRLALYALFLAVFCVLGWYSLGIGYLFGIVLILFICITLTVLCAALSHLVYNASQIQEDQDLDHIGGTEDGDYH
mgnify:CR=1 FL=1